MRPERGSQKRSYARVRRLRWRWDGSLKAAVVGVVGSCQQLPVPAPVAVCKQRVALALWVEREQPTDLLRPVAIDTSQAAGDPPIAYLCGVSDYLCDALAHGPGHDPIGRRGADEDDAVASLLMEPDALQGLGSDHPWELAAREIAGPPFEGIGRHVSKCLGEQGHLVGL